MSDEFERFLLNQDWWLLLSRFGWVGTTVVGFGRIEIPENQLAKLEEKHNTKATRIIGG